MKFIEVRDATPSPGMEWIASGYPGPGLYVVNGSRLVSVRSGGVIVGIDIDPTWIKEHPENGPGGPSETFVLALIDKTVELVRMQPARAVREMDLLPTKTEGGTV